MPSLKTIWKNSVGSAIIASFLGTAGTAVGTYLLGLWPTIASASLHAWNWLLASSEVANWLLVLIGLGIFPTLLAVVAGIRAQFAGSVSAEPQWTDYTSDTFFGLRWRWHYADGRISRLTTFCPHCDFQVFAQNASAFHAIDRIEFECDSCHRRLGEFTESTDSLESKVERFIQQKLRSGTWQSNGGM